MRILDQPSRHVVDERVERIRRRPRPHPRVLFTVEIPADRLAVEPGVAGDRRDRPTTFAQGMYFHIVLPCEHEKAGLLQHSNWRQTPAASKEARPSRRSHTGGEFR